MAHITDTEIIARLEAILAEQSLARQEVLLDSLLRDGGGQRIAEILGSQYVALLMSESLP